MNTNDLTSEERVLGFFREIHQVAQKYQVEFSTDYNGWITASPVGPSLTIEGSISCMDSPTCYFYSYQTKESREVELFSDKCSD